MSERAQQRIRKSLLVTFPSEIAGPSKIISIYIRTYIRILICLYVLITYILVLVYINIVYLGFYNIRLRIKIFTSSDLFIYITERKICKYRN